MIRCRLKFTITMCSNDNVIIPAIPGRGVSFGQCPRTIAGFVPERWGDGGFPVGER